MSWPGQWHCLLQIFKHYGVLYCYPNTVRNFSKILNQNSWRYLAAPFPKLKKDWIEIPSSLPHLQCIYSIIKHCLGPQTNQTGQWEYIPHIKHFENPWLFITIVVRSLRESTFQSIRGYFINWFLRQEEVIHPKAIQEIIVANRQITEEIITEAWNALIYIGERAKMLCISSPILWDSLASTQKTCWIWDLLCRLGREIMYPAPTLQAEHYK